MMAGLLIVLGLAAAATEECPASLILKVPGMAEQDVRSAHDYALCVRSPWLPTAEQYGARLAQCVKHRPANPSPKLVDALQWVEKMAVNFAGCETSLKITSS